MKVTYSPRDVAQIRLAFDYIARDDLVSADAFLARVEKMALLAAEHPGIGRLTNKPGVQFVNLIPYRYLMFFRVIQGRDEVRIIRVRHMSRRDAASTRGL